MNITTPTPQPKTMTSRELATVADKRHDNVMRVCRELRTLGVCPQIEETPYTVEATGQTYVQCVLNQRDSYVVMARLSPEMTGRLVDRWQELEAQVAAPAPARAGTSVADAVLIAEHISRTMRLEGAAALDITTRALAIVAPDMQPLLPGYGIDAPRGADRLLLTEGSSRVTLPLTDLLKRNGNKVSSHPVRDCNHELARLGLLEMKTRRSMSSLTGSKTYWSVTESGLAYGKNVTNPKNQRETAPHWYEDTFDKLLALVLGAAT